MYFEEPGDAKQKRNRMLLNALKISKKQMIETKGELTMEHDTRGRGQELFRTKY